MNAVAALIEQLQNSGVELRADGDRLGYHPQEALTPVLLEETKRQKWALLAHLSAADPAVVWRVEAMRARHPHESGRAAPFFTARTRPSRRGGCHSCGEPFESQHDGLVVRCIPCRHAAYLVLMDWLTNRDVPQKKEG